MIMSCLYQSLFSFRQSVSQGWRQKTVPEGRPHLPGRFHFQASNTSYCSEVVIFPSIAATVGPKAIISWAGIQFCDYLCQHADFVLYLEDSVGSINISSDSPTTYLTVCLNSGVGNKLSNGKGLQYFSEMSILKFTNTGRFLCSPFTIPAHISSLRILLLPRTLLVVSVIALRSVRRVCPLVSWSLAGD